MKTAEEMTREEFIEKWGASMGHGFTDEELSADLDSLSLPPAEGAEEILDKYPHSTEYPSFIHENSAIAAMHEFATLHAQKMADKMVGERLREELMTYDKFLSNTYWGISHITKREEAVNEYLKSREK